MTSASAAQKLADSVALTLTARAMMIVTPLVVAAFGWFLSDMIGTQRGDVAAVADRVTRIEADMSAIKSRASVLENSAISAKDGGDKFQSQVIDRMNRIETKVGDLAEGVAGLNAKVETLISQRRADAFPGR